MPITPKQIIVDFDGTVVRHEWPRVGAEVDHAVHVLKRLQQHHTLILVTMRQDELLENAMLWFSARDIKITYVNRNEMYETGSRKIYAHMIIDDKCCGIPMVYHPYNEGKPFVDWKAVEKILEEKGYL
jgi:hypothetical protein